MGFVFNALTVVVFVRYHRWGKPGVIYLCYLAFVDAFYVFWGFVLWLNYGLSAISFGKYSLDFEGLSLHTCRLGYYCRRWALAMSEIITIAMTFERFLAIRFPMFAKQWLNSQRKRVYLLVFSTVSTTAVEVRQVFLYELAPEYNTANEATVCTETRQLDPDLTYHLTFTLFILFYHVLPAMLLLVINVLISVSLLSNSRWFKNDVQSTVKRQETSISVTLIMVSTIFIVFNLPLIGGWIYGYYVVRNPHLVSRNDMNNLLALYWLVSFVSLINYIVNFPVYIIRLPYFKSQLKSMFYC
ncbi:uncharacterized protein LOC141905560 [Tubulanus polymorphus]|uniref:uncharacterized protein LOC141905560 n=1 Tax=Tubulanus polymorphus TaxID=672921 RepID=UPI003DA641F0